MLSFSGNRIPDDYPVFDIKLAGRVKEMTQTDSIRWSRPEHGGLDSFLSWANTYTYRYDKQGKAKVISRYGETGRLLYTDSVCYDDMGNRLELHYHNHTKQGVKKLIDLSDRAIIRYDDRGHKVRDDEYDCRGKLLHNQQYKYDTAGHCVEQDYYWQDSLRTIYVYRYNAQGQCSEKEDFNISGKSRGKTVFMYDGKGLQVGKHVYHNDSLLRRSVFTYDGHDNIVEWKTYFGRNDSSTNKTEYEYDKNGNWIDQKAFNKGKLGMHYIRKIKYY